MPYESALPNQNKGYAKQEKKDLMNDMPIDKRASGGSWMSKHSQSKMGGSPLSKHSEAQEKGLNPGLVSAIHKNGSPAKRHFTPEGGEAFDHGSAPAKMSMDSKKKKIERKSKRVDNLTSRAEKAGNKGKEKKATRLSSKAEGMNAEKNFLVKDYNNKIKNPKSSQYVTSPNLMSEKPKAKKKTYTQKAGKLEKAGK